MYLSGYSQSALLLAHNVSQIMIPVDYSMLRTPGIIILF